MKNKLVKFSALSLMILSTLWIFWLSLTPLIDRDATRFHLPFAKLWADNTFLYFRPYFAYYDLNMLNLNYLYMLVFKLGLPDQFTKIIHASFLIAGGFLIYRYFKEKYGFNWGAIAFILYTTIPIHQRLASEVYVDLGLLFFSTLSVIYLVKWFESDFNCKRHLIVSAIGAGFSMGTKYNGMVIVFFLTLFVGLMVAREKKDDKLAIKSMLLYGVIVAICVSPWLLRNFIDSGNPFFPLFQSIFHTPIDLPKNLVENVTGETMNRIVNGKDSVLSLFMLPFRVFFEGTDHDFLKFDGTLNPLLILLLPFLYLFKTKDRQKGKLLNYLFTLFITVYFVTLYSNNIRIRYFIPVLPVLIILNVEALRNLLSVKKASVLCYLILFLYIFYNINYGIFLSKNLHLSDYNPFKSDSKKAYLEKYLRNYEVFKYINENTPENSIIYEAFTGGRNYYINRTFYSDTTSLDRYLLELAKNGAIKEDYSKHFQNLPNSNLSATHILIRPNDFVKTFFDIYKTEDDPDNIENNKKIQGYVQYINSLKILYRQNDVYLFELN